MRGSNILFMPNLWIWDPLSWFGTNERFRYTNQLQKYANMLVMMYSNCNFSTLLIYCERTHHACGICSSNISLQQSRKWSDCAVMTLLNNVCDTLLGVPVMAIDQNHTSKYRHIPTAQLRIDAMFCNVDLWFIHHMWPKSINVGQDERTKILRVYLLNCYYRWMWCLFPRECRKVSMFQQKDDTIVQ